MRIVRGLVWEEWRQTRLYLGFGAFILGAFFGWVQIMSILEGFEGRVAMPLTGSLALMLLVFLFIHQTMEGLSFGFPRRRLVLPVRTVALTTATYAYRLVVAAAIGLLLAAGTRLALDVPQPWWISPLVLVTAMALLQAGFTLAVSRKWAALLTHGIPVLLLAAVLHPVWMNVPEAFFAGEKLGDGWPLQLLLLSAATIAGSWWISVVEVERVRGGRMMHLGGAVWTSPAWSWHPDASSSSLLAGMWYEWRQTLWLLPRLAAAIFAMLVFFGLVIPASLAALPVLGGLATIVCAYGIGHYHFRTTSWHRGQTLTRPESTSALVETKLVAGIFALLLTQLATVIFTALILLIIKAFYASEVSGFHYQIHSVSLLLLQLAALVIALFSGRALTLFFGCTWLPIFPLLIFKWAHDPQGQEILALGVFAVFAIAVVLINGWALWRGTLRARTLALYIAACAAGFLLLLAVNSTLILESALAPLVWLTLLLSVPGYTAAVIEHQRHQ